MGRPTKLTPQLQKEMVRIVQGGNYIETACDYVGLAKRTFYLWLERGKRGWKIDAPYVQFLHAILEARAAAEIESVKRIRASAKMGKVEDDKFFLTHAYPGRWGMQAVRAEIGGAGGNPVEIKVVWGVPRPSDE